LAYEREGEREVVCAVTTFSLGRKGKTNFPPLKICRQCPVFPVVERCLREGKSLGSEKGKGLGCGNCYEHRTEAELMTGSFDFNVGRTTMKL
jgi:hypothetical protein